MGNYVLEGHTPVLETDVLVWAKWFESESSATSRIIGRTEIANDICVSTVFLGLNYQFGDGPPLLFETMVFGGALDGKESQYSTWDEAEAGHEDCVNKVKIAEASAVRKKLEESEERSR